MPLDLIRGIDEAASSLRGKITSANARAVIGAFAKSSWALLSRNADVEGGPALSDVLYIEEFFGPHTINTILPETLHAFRDHRRVQRTLETGEQDAERALARLAKLGIDLGGNHRETARRWHSPPSPVLWTSSWPR